MTGWLACLLTRPPRRRQIVKLKPEYYDKYKEVHAAVWPEVLRQIKACNIVDCRFLPSIISPAPRPAPGSYSWSREPESSGGGKQPSPPLTVQPEPGWQADGLLQIPYSMIAIQTSFLRLSNTSDTTMPGTWRG